MKSEIKRAQAVLAKRDAALRLVNKHGQDSGSISWNGLSPVLHIHSDMAQAVTLETMERWVKQAKDAKRKGYLG